MTRNDPSVLLETFTIYSSTVSGRVLRDYSNVNESYLRFRDRSRYSDVLIDRDHGENGRVWTEVDVTERRVKDRVI